MTDLRLLPAALVAWLVAGVGIGLPAWVAGLLAVGSGTGAVLCAVRARGLRSLLALAAIALVAGALTGAAVAAQAPGRSPAVLVEAATSGRTVTLRIEATSRATSGRLAATVLAATVGDRTTTASVPILVLGEPQGHSLDGARIGEVLQLDASLQPGDPGDTVAYLAHPRGSPIPVASPPPLLQVADGVRVALVRATRELPGDGGDLLPGLAIGDTAQVTPDLTDAMKASSLTHLTAVSGDTNPSPDASSPLGLIGSAGWGPGGTSRLVESLLQCGVRATSPMSSRCCSVRATSTWTVRSSKLWRWTRLEPTQRSSQTTCRWSGAEI